MGNTTLLDYIYIYGKVSWGGAREGHTIPALTVAIELSFVEGKHIRKRMPT